MAKLINLVNQHIKVVKGQELEPNASDESGPVVVETFTLVMTDKGYGDQIAVTFGKEVRDEVVKDLMGGVILPGGALT